MPVMLFKLRGVPEDEANAVRALLVEHGIDFYETGNGRWGLGFAAIWLHDASRLAESRALIDAHQRAWMKAAQDAYAKQCANGEASVFSAFRQRPLQVILALLGIAVVGFVALSPFVF